MLKFGDWQCYRKGKSTQDLEPRCAERFANSAPQNMTPRDISPPKIWMLFFIFVFVLQDFAVKMVNETNLGNI